MSGQAEFWNERYSGEGFSFGTEPNAFLASQAHRLKPGMRALVPGDGEGRNGVWLARQGLPGRRSARAAGVRQSARRRNRCPDRRPSRLGLAARALRYHRLIHFFGADRPRMHRAMLDALKPGGLIILEAFRIEQLEFQKLHRSGGPREAGMLCSRAKLESEFTAPGSCCSKKPIPISTRAPGTKAPSGRHSRRDPKAAMMQP